MQFSDTVNKNGIIEDITFLTGIDINAYPLLDRTRNVNEAYRKVWSIIFEAYGGWKFIDSNSADTSTGVPYADQTLTASTGLYQLPSSSLAIDGVFIKTTSGGTFTKLTPLSHEEFIALGGDGYFTSTGVPLYYMLQGDILRILPIPNFTLSNALRIFFDQGISAFVSTDTTKVPGFDENYHRLLSIGASVDYAIANGLQKLGELQRLWDDYEKRMRSFYAKRFKERFPSRIPPSRDLVEEFR